MAHFEGNATMKYPRTREEASSLPEIASLVNEGLFFGAGGVHGDQIILFVDDDGISKTVHCVRRSPDGRDEWVKTPLRL